MATRERTTLADVVPAPGPEMTRRLLALLGQVRTPARVDPDGPVEDSRRADLSA